MQNKEATFDNYASVDWEPWTREPHMEPDELVPKDQTMRDCGMVARMAYAAMLMTRDKMIAMHDKANSDTIIKMAGEFAETSRILKEIALMLDTAYLRVLASSAAYVNDERHR